MLALVWDYRKNIIRFEEHSVDSLFTRNNELLAVENGTTVHELYSSSDDASAHFKSGWLGEGGLIAEKAQDRLRLVYQGEIEFTLYVNGESVYTKSLSSVGVDVLQFKFPQSTTRNNYVEVELEGPGSVYELSIPQESANV